ncbi:MAG: hypothetical protein COB46_06765 [Rhodospirillaceae bacterium]|nr:MAG: hypothetical protein COB46_06765 [Rhodospirillaceae bacterium]
MFIIRGLMNHLVIVFIGVLVVVGIVNKDKIKTELTQMGYLESSSNDGARTSQEDDAVVATEAEARGEAVAATQPVAQAMPTHLTPARASAPAQAQQVQAAPAAPAAPAPAQAPYYAQQQQMQQQMQQQQMQQRMQKQMQARQPQTNEVALAEDVKTQWAAARTAYWKRDLDKAEELYKALLETSNEAGIAGELGNIYFTHRRFEDAANMFYEAGLRHLKSDTPEQANRVMGPLSQLDRKKADELRTKLMVLQSNQAKSANSTPQPAKN